VFSFGTCVLQRERPEFLLDMWLVCECKRRRARWARVALGDVACWWSDRAVWADGGPVSKVGTGLGACYERTRVCRCGGACPESLECPNASPVAKTPMS
jgi:hypothetical protein